MVFEPCQVSHFLAPVRMPSKLSVNNSAMSDRLPFDFDHHRNVRPWVGGANLVYVHCEPIPFRDLGDVWGRFCPNVVPVWHGGPVPLAGVDGGPVLVHVHDDVGSHRGITCRCSHSEDRKSTRLNSSHVKISYAVFCLKKKIR